MSIYQNTPPRQLYQLEHFVDIWIDAAQHDLDVFIVCYPGQLLHCIQRLGIDSMDGGEIQYSFAFTAIQPSPGLSQGCDHSCFINVQKDWHHRHMLPLLTPLAAQARLRPSPHFALHTPSKTVQSIPSSTACAGSTATRDRQMRS